MKEVRAWVTDCGKLYKYKQSAKNHERICKCWSNPKFKTCKTCKFGELHNYGGEEISDPYPMKGPDDWKWKCNHVEPVDPDSPAFTLVGHKDFMLNSNCPKWESKK